MWDFRFFKVMKSNEKIRKLKLILENYQKTQVFDLK